MLRRAIPILVGLLVVAAQGASAAGGKLPTLPLDRAVPLDLLPSRDDAPPRSLDVPIRADTIWYGSYEVIGGEYYALRSSLKQDVMWTFDRGNGPRPPTPVPEVIPDGEGWFREDLTESAIHYFRVIDNALNLGNLPGGGAVPPPILGGARSLWVGADQAQADAFCWPCRSGYGNAWCQRASSPILAYDGSGDVTVNMMYWNDSEPCFDGTQIYLRRSDNTELLLNPYQPAGTCPGNLSWDGGFTDRVGTFDANGVVIGFESFNHVITQAQIGGSPTIQVVLEYSSDSGWSDEDCQYPTVQGPFGADNISLSNNLIGGDVAYDFETGLQGWTAGTCNPIGDFIDITDVGVYTILDPCACRLENNILEMHADVGDDGSHPMGQYCEVISPICELDPGLKVIFMEFDMYAEMPQQDGTAIRPCWVYYPFVCPATGVVGWSPIVGQDGFNYAGDDPVCATYRYGGTDVGDGVPVPADALKIRAIIQFMNNCETFSIDPCSGITNKTPLFDNIAVGVTPGINAPSIGFDTGTQFQDNGSFPSDLFDVRAVVPASITRDKHMDTSPGQARDLLGDSLVVSGPIPGSDPNTRWEARMWWRVARRGPFQADRENGVDTRYKVWKTRVSDGLQIDRPYRPQFTFAWMDSVQVGPVPVRNKFKSDFREGDDDFVGEGNAENEMIWDDVLRPGTRIEYFITSNYAVSPTSLYYLPDTTGGFFLEFEALPGIRTANVPNCGAGQGYNYCVFQPATLYVDAYNGGAQFFIENALRSVLNGLDPCLEEDGCVIPQDRNWDRYDYLDSSSNWNAGIARGSVAGSNNGLTVNQLLGYRTILVNTGIFGNGCMQDEDFPLFDAWLGSAACAGALNRQVFIMNGDKTGELLELPGGQDSGVFGPAFMANTLGAILFCDAFNGFTDDPDCGAESSSYCVRLLATAGGPFGTLTDVDAYGNYCPNVYGMNVFSPNGTGVGNRTYSAEDPPKVMSYEQMTNQNLEAPNYRTILDGVSYHHMAKRNAGGVGEGRCPRDTPSIVDGALSEIRAALRWGFGVAEDAGIPKLTSAFELADCQGTWDAIPTDVGGEGTLRVNRLFQNEPNPFNPRTTIKFSLARPGEVELMIYDANGRMVKTLVEGKKDAGTYQVVWDGTNDEGRKVASGVYWSQMKAGTYVSSKKLVILK